MTKLRTRVFATIVAILAIINVAYAQQATTYTGTVLDENGGVMPGAYIELLTDEESDPITAVITDNQGRFTTNTAKNVQLIRSQFIGFEPVIIKAPFTFPIEIKMETLTIEMEGVTIVEEATSSITNGGIKFAPTEMQRDLPNVTQYLAELPFVEESGTAFKVVGKESTVIYVNNRKLQDNSELKEIKMDEIVSVDVIPNPGASYGADVKSVIRIKTKRKTSGVGAEIDSYVIHNNRTEYWNSVGFDYNTEKFSLTSSLIYDYKPTHAQIDIVQTMRGQKDTTKAIYNTTEDQLRKYLTFRNNLVYEPNDNNSLGISLNYQKTKYDTDVINDLTFIDSTGKILYQQKSTSYSPNQSIFGNAFYNYSTEKFNLLLNADIHKGGNTNEMISVSSDTLAEPNVSTYSDNDNLLYYLQATASYSFTESLNLEIGTDYSHTSVHQKYDVSETLSTLQSFDIETFQHRYASYATVNYMLDPFAFSVGVRHEGISLNRKDQENTTPKEFFSRAKLYPTASISMSKDAFQAQFSYSMMTDYPSYNSLLDGLNYSSPYLYEGGNSNLTPELYHDFTLVGKYKKTTVMLNYYEIQDQIMQIPSLLEDDIMIYRYGNYGPNKYLTASFSQRFKWGELAETTLNADYQGQWLNIPGFTNERGDGFRVRLNNSIKLAENIRLRVNGAYSSKMETNVFEIPQSWNVNLSLNFSFLDDQLSLYVGCTDIFSTRHDIRYYSGKDITMDYSRNYETRTFTLNLTYQLANLISGKYYRGNSSNDEIRRL